MKYCSKCGEEIYDEAVICPRCGYNTERSVLVQEQGLKVAGFCLGIFGLIIGLCLNKQLTKKGAIGGFIWQFVLGSIIGLIYF